MIPRCLKKMLSFNDQNSSSPNDQNVIIVNDENSPITKREFHASFLEIYNEKLFDLLSETTNEPIVAKGNICYLI